MDRKFRILVRGAGDLATGVLHGLFTAGFRPLALEAAQPSAIRRQVAFSECVYDGSAEVEGVRAVLARSLPEAEDAMRRGLVPVLVDPVAASVFLWHPDVVVDAIIAKRDMGTRKSMADVTIALGPGYVAGRDVDYVIETMRGHSLGRIITNGPALADTKTPGVIAGYGKERVMHAPAAGIFRNVRAIGDCVTAGEEIAYIETEDGGHVPLPASLSGLIRGLIRDGFSVPEGFKVADIDPRTEEYKNCFTISDKARCLSGSVLELVCQAYFNCSSARRETLALSHRSNAYASEKAAAGRLPE